MQKLLPLTALALLTTSATALADGSEWLAGKPSDAVRAQAAPTDKARTYLAAEGAALRLANVELGAPRTLRGAGGSAVVRYGQRYLGLPVLGQSVVVGIGRDGDVTRVVLSVARELALATTPALDVAAATLALETAVARTLPAPERSALVVSPERGGTLLWQLDVRDSVGGTRYWVDATTGALFGTRSLARDALGRVYEENSLDTPVPIDVELLEMDVATPQYLNGWNGLLQVTNWVSGTSQNGYTVEQTLVPSDGTNFLYDPPADVHDGTDGFAQVNLYYHLTSMKTFAASLGVPVDQPSWKVTAVANAQENGQALDNAFFSEMGQTGAYAAPNLIAIGQGTQNDFAYDSDVFKHEFGHYLTHNAVGYNLGQTYTTSYGISPFSGAIDEGVSDYLACTNNDDPVMGEASLGNQQRVLTNTTAVCPDDMFGEVHADGEIIGSLSWSVRTALGAAAADELVWGAIAMLPDGATFGDYGRALVSSAEALVTAGTLQAADVQTVTDLVAARGLDNCDAVIALAPGESRNLTTLGLTMLASFFGGTCAQLQGFGVSMPALFHFSRQVAASDTGLHFAVHAVPSGGGNDPTFSIYGRKGTHVTFKNGAMIPVPDQYDLKVDVAGTDGEVVFDAASAVPFDPTAEYFFAIVNTGCPTLALSVTTTTDGAGAGGAGGGGAGAGGAGA
ncbi:MAG: hypothetical protein HY908_21835, partial [Myxococcales bacterium]|nr:hypothetical protein [Myxococcales bacterium]